MKSDDVIVSFRGVRRPTTAKRWSSNRSTSISTAGEFLTLLGPSGPGKTTCLMMLAGFEFPTGGEIRLDGELLEQRAAAQAQHRHGVPELRCFRT